MCPYVGVPWCGRTCSSRGIQPTPCLRGRWRTQQCQSPHLFAWPVFRHFKCECRFLTRAGWYLCMAFIAFLSETHNNGETHKHEFVQPSQPSGCPLESWECERCACQCIASASDATEHEDGTRRFSCHVCHITGWVCCVTCVSCRMEVAIRPTRVRTTP